MSSYVWICSFILYSFASTPCLFASKLTFRVLVRKKSATFVILVRSCLEAHVSGSGLEQSSVKVNLKAESWWLANDFWACAVPLKPPKTSRPCVHAVHSHGMRHAVLIFLTQRWALWQMDCTLCAGRLLYITHRPARADILLSDMSTSITTHKERWVEIGR